MNIINMNVNDYKEIRGTLIKKKRTVFGRYRLYISDGANTVSVLTGKSIFSNIRIGTQLTVGYIGRNLINIRPGIAWNDD